jgi:hypothetical protein
MNTRAACAGCPNSNDFGGDKVLHHTIGEVDFSQELRCAAAVSSGTAPSAGSWLPQEASHALSLATLKGACMDTKPAQAGREGDLVHLHELIGPAHVRAGASRR